MFTETVEKVQSLADELGNEELKLASGILEYERDRRTNTEKALAAGARYFLAELCPKLGIVPFFNTLEAGGFATADDALEAIVEFKRSFRAEWQGCPGYTGEAFPSDKTLMLLDAASVPVGVFYDLNAQPKVFQFREATCDAQPQAA